MATAKISITRDAETAALILKDIKDRQAECPHTINKAVEIIKKWIRKDGLNFVNPKARKLEKVHAFNKYCFQAFIHFYDMKNNEKYCYKYDRTSSPSYSYSDAALHLIYEEIQKNPYGIMQVIYDKIKQVGQMFLVCWGQRLLNCTCTSWFSRVKITAQMDSFKIVRRKSFDYCVCEFSAF